MLCILLLILLTTHTTFTMDQAETQFAQTITKPNAIPWEKHFRFLEKQCAGKDKETLHVSSTSPTYVSYYDGTFAKQYEDNNLPDPQYWTKQENEKSYNIRYSYDQKKIDVNFILPYPKNNNSPIFLFDGNNKHFLHAQIDDINQKSKLYLLPGNKNDLIKATYDDTQQFLHSRIKQTISAITLSSDSTHILYCYKDKTNKQHYMQMINRQDKSQNKLIVTPELFKKVLMMNALIQQCLCLSDTGKLYMTTKDECTEQKTTLRFVDIALDPENNNLAFLDTEGRIYTTKQDNLSQLTHIDTIQEIHRLFVHGISYLNGICNIIYHTTDNNPLFSGSCHLIGHGEMPEDIVEKKHIDEIPKDIVEEKHIENIDNPRWKQFLLPVAAIAFILIGAYCYKYLQQK